MAVEREQLDIALEASDDQAWERVVLLEGKVGTRLYGYAVHLGVDGPRANDLVQDALLRLWRELRRGWWSRPPSPGSSGRSRASRWMSTASTGAFCG
jgi:DNA-directed RNA polymerase specialized sigma24 family protein